LEIDRWDVVAVRASDDRPAMIKRVIGLPGESIRFVDGDVFADGKLVQKPRHIAEATRIPVFDSACSSADVLRRFVPRKLQAGKADAGSWSIRDGMWSYSPTSTGETRWLAYEQWRCVSSSLPKDQVVSVEDWYEANVNVNRNLNRVKDIWARIEFRAAEECQVDVAVTVGQKRLVYEIDFGQRRVFFEGRSVSFRGDDSSAADAATGLKQPFRIDVCTFDRQLTMRINGVGLPAVDLPPSEGSAQALPAIEIGGSETPLVMTRFRLWRDIHYFDHGAKNGSDGGTRLVAGPNEYLLVGDNVPVSVDSRHWPVPAVSGNDILGTIDNKK
jgi:signal peptidase I